MSSERTTAAKSSKPLGVIREFYRTIWYIDGDTGSRNTKGLQREYTFENGSYHIVRYRNVTRPKSQWRDEIERIRQ